MILTKIQKLWILRLIAIMTSSVSFAENFEKGVEEEFKFTRYSDDQIQIEIQNKIKVACKGDRCELASVTNRGESFVVSIHAGINENNTNTGSGVVIVDGGHVADNNSNGPSIGVTMKYVKGQCTQTVHVPQSLYIAMNTYLYRLLNEDGSIERQFSPAQQTMILFYTTILKQASGCQILQ